MDATVTSAADNAKFYNRDGSLTRYALACGYRERFEVSNCEGWIHVELWEEHGALHVRRYDSLTGRREWSTYHALKKARRAYRLLVRRTLATDSPTGLEQGTL